MCPFYPRIVLPTGAFLPGWGGMTPAGKTTRNSLCCGVEIMAKMSTLYWMKTGKLWEYGHLACDLVYHDDVYIATQ